MERTQTIIRLSPELLQRVKNEAKKQNRSLNSFIENTLERATELQFPPMPPDMKIDDDILAIAGCIKEPTEEMLKNDPKLAYLWEKYGES